MASPRSARLRDDAGADIGATDASTICWFPRKPSQLTWISADGTREHVLRCGFCGGCRELDRRRLCARLVKLYREYDGAIWMVRVPCPLLDQAAMLERVSTITSVEFEPGFYRLNVGEVAFLCRGAKPEICRLRPLRGTGATVRKIHRHRRKSAWREITAGLAEHRESFGKWINRYYHRGLPQLDRDAGTIDTRRGIRKRNPALRVGARAIADDVGIYPPDAWRPVRLVRRKGPIERRVSRTPVPIGTLLENLMPQSSASSAGRITPLSPRAKARVSSMPGVPDAPAVPLQRARHSDGERVAHGRATFFQKPIQNSILGGVTEVLRSRPRAGPLDFAVWADRMTQKSRERDPKPKK